MTGTPMEPAPRVVSRELVLGGQRSGKSRRAEQLAQHWLARDAAHGATFIATATAHDDDMRARIARHRADRAQHLPRMACVEAPVELAGAIAQSPAMHDANHLLVVDCLTLWLTNLQFPLAPREALLPDALALQCEALQDALAQCAGPVVLVSNEIGLGVVPMGRDVRAYVDALGRLNQQMAAACTRVCLMVAGHPVWVKGAPVGAPAMSS